VGYETHRLSVSEARLALPQPHASRVRAVRRVAIHAKARQDLAVALSSTTYPPDRTAELQLSARRARPYILCLNCPYNTDPDYALFTSPRGGAGHRLWSMVNEITGIDCNQWLLRTQRVNLLTDTALPRDYRSAARRRGQFLAPLVRGRVVVLLGADVATAVGHDAEPFVWSRSWISIPHPSGRNHYYNDPVRRAAAGLLLADVLEMCRSQCSA
jgi:hypothetical protein